jgi:hypothetical protein
VIRDGTDLSGVVDGRPGTGCDIVAVDRNLRTPYVQTWTFSLQHAITNNVVIDLAYVGNHGALLVGRSDRNQPQSALVWNTPYPAGTDIDGDDVSGMTPLAACLALQNTDACQGEATDDNLELSLRPYNTKFPYLNNIIDFANQQTSNYNAFQMQVTARNFHGLSSTLGYTWGKALEISSSSEDTDMTDGYNPSLDYGPGRNDLRHRLSISTVYQVPQVMGYGGLLQGWRLNGIMRYQTGQNWNPEADADWGATGRSSRWDFFGDTSDFKSDYTGQEIAVFHPEDSALGDPNGNRGATGNYVLGDLATQTPACRDNARSQVTLALFGCWTQGNSAILPPPPGTVGNMVKGSFRGPSYFNIDFSVTKRHQITERYTAEFRVESFNILNHPAFADLETGLGCNVGSCGLASPGATPNVAATNSFLGSGGQRRFQFGAKFIF